MKESRQGYRFAWLWVCFGLSAAWLIVQPAPRSVPASLLLVLAFTAFGAELADVKPMPKGAHFAVTGAYLAAIACFWSPLAALVTDIVVMLLAGAVRRQSQRAVGERFLSRGIACALASAPLQLLPWNARVGESAPIGVLLFMLVFGGAIQMVGFAFAKLRDEAFRGWTEALVGVNPIRLLAYVVVGALLAVICRDRLTWVVPLTLVPVLAFRLGVMRREAVADAYYDTVTALTLMLQRAHPDTHDHLDRVARTAERVAEQLGLGARRSELVRAAAVLHDIGKIAVDESVLDKPGRLTAAERAHVENHALWGAQILTPIHQFRELVPWIRHHHERPDGTGYPDRLNGVEIPIESRIIAVVDAFDAMTGGDRAYRRPMSQDQAIAELRRCAPTQFDSTVVAAFAQVIDEVPS